MPAKPSPETEILEKIPPELQDPLMFPAPSKPEPPGPLGPYRVLAPGVMSVIPPDRNPEDSVNVHNVVELQQYDWAKGIPIPPRRLGLGVPLQAGADSRRGRAAAQRKDAAQADLVPGCTPSPIAAR